jgi:hypothetical protein
MGNFAFGSSSSNPLDSGNGYANMLLGIYSTYTETTVRVDKDVRHWQNEGYAQDSWRVNSRLTLDYGVRLTHSGSWYEINHMTAAFYPELYDITQAPRIYMPYCSNGAAGNVACPASSRFAIDPADPNKTLVNQAFAGSFVPGTGNQINGMKQDGRNGKGNYFDFPYLVAAPRFGMAWDVKGDGRSAVRASAGMFYNLPRGQPSQFIGNPPVSFNNVIRNSTIDDIRNISNGKVAFSANPIGSAIATLKGLKYELPIAYNVNFAYQRDIGFSTVVEAAYVGNFTYNDYRSKDLEIVPLYFYASPATWYNQTKLSYNYFRKMFPGMADITQTYNEVNSLFYNSFQLSVQRRLSKGLQLGMAYTLSKGMGEQGWDPYTADPNISLANVGGDTTHLVQGGPAALRARYWGPTNIDRRHNLSFNYSYQIPNPARNVPVLKYIVSDWQVSGVTKWTTGTAVNPACSSNGNGVPNSDPTLTDGGARCMLTGEPINMGKRVDVDPANPDILTAKFFNTAAFAFATPVSSTVGNFGNAPLDLLRNPSYSSWDVTLARRIPVKIGRNGGVRVQLQAYNIFNLVRFQNMNATMQFTGANNATLNSTTVGQLSSVIPPRQLGLTVRLDF